MTTEQFTTFCQTGLTGEHFILSLFADSLVRSLVSSLVRLCMFLVAAVAVVAFDGACIALIFVAASDDGPSSSLTRCPSNWQQHSSDNHN